MKVAVNRKAFFNAVHRLHNAELDKEENEKIFGKCNNPNFHGHNYELIVKVIGEIDPITGYVVDMKVLKDLIDQFVIEKFDQKNLNTDTPEFKKLNPTAENIAVVIYNTLKNQLDRSLELKIILYETERNFVEYPAS